MQVMALIGHIQVEAANGGRDRGIPMSNTRVKLAALGAAAVVAAAGLGWWAGGGLSGDPTVGTFRMFLGKVSIDQVDGAQIAYRCITPDSGEDSGLPVGQDWCGQVYPSEGLQPAGLTTGTRVRVISFDTGVSLVTTPVTGGTTTKLFSALVLPADAPEPPGGSEPVIRTHVDAVAFAPHLVGLAEADAVSASTGAGFVTRTVARTPGEPFFITLERVGNRINLTVVDGIVTATKIG